MFTVHYLKLVLGNANVGALPGVTRHVQMIRVSAKPEVLLLDTPGVLVANFDNFEVGLKLGLVGAIRDQRIGEDTLADYLLFTLNKLRAWKYVQHFNMAAPTDDVNMMLQAVGTKLGNTDELTCARLFLKAYREGSLGNLTLDDIPATDIFE